MKQITDEDIEILARTLYGEARGEYVRKEGGLAALMAVAAVVMNRVKKGGWFGASIQEVCLKPFQFSCWNPKDPNAALVKKKEPITGPVFVACLRTAEEMAHGRWPDITRGADHYHADYCEPRWAQLRDPVAQVGRHIFYKLEA